MVLNLRACEYHEAGYIEDESVRAPGYPECCCFRVTRDAPPEVVADLRNDNKEWQRQYGGAPLYLFPGDEGY